MSGKILIVDELATNRIVLKVKLSAAYYDVLQARTGAEALKMVAGAKPDLILTSSELSDCDSAAFLDALRAQENNEAVPVVLLVANNSQSERIAALKAGYSDVLTKPLDETLLLARLRSLLRQRHLDHDLKLHAGTARALGFADSQRGFLRPGRIAAVARSKADAAQMRTRLAAGSAHEFLSLTTEHAVNFPSGVAPPDIFVLQFEKDSFDDGLRLMAELRATPKTRNCPIIAVLPKCAKKIAATVLDMGANDMICEPIHPQELALRIATQLDYKQTADKMRDQLHNGLQAAVIDPLTGLYNRRYALSFLDRLVKSSHVEGRSFAVMVADLDLFKRINDQHGHAAGDAVLSHVSETLRTNLRDEDLIARIGGEEFLIVTPDTNSDQAGQTASRLCRIVGRTPINVPGQAAPIDVTVSIGVAMAHTGLDGALPTVNSLLDQADRALYGSKAGGRNMFTLNARPAA